MKYVTSMLILTAGLMASFALFGLGPSGQMAFLAYAQYAQLFPPSGAAEPTYWIYINPGGSFDPREHYSPSRVSVPGGMTIQWLNNDVNQIHTVTSGLPGAVESGSQFNSGNMFTGGAFQATFGNASGLVGDVPFYCIIHPWATGTISVSDTVVRGESFEMLSGAGSEIELPEEDRTVIVFNPIALAGSDSRATYYPSSPITYKFSILDSENEEVFSDVFQPAGVNLQVELINVADGSANVTDAPLSSMGAGGAHIRGNLFSEPGTYTLVTEVTRIGTSSPPEPMTDEFQIQVSMDENE